MSNGSMLVSAHPVIPVRDMDAALAYYTDKLGFAMAFNDADDAGDPIS